MKLRTDKKIKRLRSTTFTIAKGSNRQKFQNCYRNIGKIDNSLSTITYLAFLWCTNIIFDNSKLLCWIHPSNLIKINQNVIINFKQF